jgi:hypothetical protein
MRGTLMPKACTSAGFSVAARRYDPSLVRSMTNQVERHTMSEATITHARYFGRNMKPRLNEPANSAGRRYGWPELP